MQNIQEYLKELREAHSKYSIFIISNRPRVLKENLERQLGVIADPEVKTIIMTNKECMGEVAEICKEIKNKRPDIDVGIIEYHGTIALLKNKFPSIPWDEICFGRLIGRKNLALLLGQMTNKGIIFLDDDILPEADWLEKYKDLFAEGYELITGSYVGHNASFLDIIDKIIYDINKDILDGEILSNFLRRSPSLDYKKVLFVCGGNMGITPSLARRMCFDPSNYRIEDLNYWVAASKLEIKCTYNDVLKNPDSYENMINKLPFGEHKNQPIDKATFNSGLIEDIKSQIIGRAIAAYILNNFEVDWEKIIQEAKRTEKEVHNKLQAGFDIIKNELTKADMDGRFGKENVSILKEISHLDETDYIVSDSEIKTEVLRFHNSLSRWNDAISTINRL